MGSRLVNHPRSSLHGTRIAQKFVFYRITQLKPPFATFMKVTLNLGPPVSHAEHHIGNIADPQFGQYIFEERPLGDSSHALRFAEECRSEASAQTPD